MSGGICLLLLTAVAVSFPLLLFAVPQRLGRTMLSSMLLLGFAFGRFFSFSVFSFFLVCLFFGLFLAECSFLSLFAFDLWPFLVFASVYLCCPCAGRHLLFFVPQGDFLRGVFQRKVGKRKALRKLVSSRCVTRGEWQPMKCHPLTPHAIGPRAIASLTHSAFVTRQSSTPLRTACVAVGANTGEAGQWMAGGGWRVAGVGCYAGRRREAETGG
ncbi:hypothetical protein R70241_02823 [Paraburkholderia saeva]|nr:hypothetical protein R70241_02823 [Paraburkholderia saeva]